MSVGSHLVFSDLRILSSLQDTAQQHPPHVNSMALPIYLRINKHFLAAPRHLDATATTQRTYQPNHAFCSWPETISLTREIAE
jgi:hypothetical protein